MPGFAGRFHIFSHAVTRDRQLAVIAHRQVSHLLDARDVRCKGGNDDAVFGFPEDVIEGFIDDTFGRRPARSFCVGAVTHQQDDSPLGEFPKPGIVWFSAVDRRVVKLVIAAVNDDAKRRMNAEANTVRDAVRHRIAFQLERADLERVSGFERVDRGVAAETCAPQLDIQQHRCQRGCVDRRTLEGVDHIRDCADVVFMPVGIDDAMNPEVLAFLKIPEIRDDQVNSEHIIGREHHACIEDKGVVAELEDGHVLTDLAKPAEGNYSEFFRHTCWY